MNIVMQYNIHWRLEFYAIAEVIVTNALKEREENILFTQLAPLGV